MKNALLLLVGFFLSISGPAQFNPQTASLTRKFFPEADLDIATPAFRKQRGFTQYSEMMAWLEPLLQTHGSVLRLRIIGESQKGKKIPLLLLSRQNGKAKTRVWIQGGLHGDEPAGTESVLFLLVKLLEDKSLEAMLENLDIALVPMANIDGYNQHKRASANGIDLNRDQTSLRARETVSLKRAFHEFQPAVALDMHEFRPFRKDFTRLGKTGVTAYYDAMFLYSGNLNVPENLRRYTENTFVEQAGKVLDQHQLRHRTYLTPQKNGGRVEFNLGSVHSRSSATSYALTQCVSTLIEIRGVGIGRTSFKRRVKTGYLIARSFLETASQKAEELKSVLAEAEKGRHPVVVISDREIEKDTLTLIDLASETAIRLPVWINNALKSKAVLQRDRPGAYVLLPSEKEAVFRLRVLGVHLDSLAAETSLEVEAFDAARFTEGEEEEEKNEEEDSSEKEARAGTTRKQTMVLPKGTWIVPMNQKYANLVAELLEPESVNGFVAGGIIRTSSGIPIYRYLGKWPKTP